MLEAMRMISSSERPRRLAIFVVTVALIKLKVTSKMVKVGRLEGVH